jgi:SPP1 gp7 family putative phage head morphogenesis protein
MEDNPFGENQQRNAALIAELYQYLVALNTEHTQEIIKEIERFAQYEANYISNMMSSKVESRFAQIAPQQINQAVFGGVMDIEPIRGYKIRDAFDEFGVVNASKIQTLLREGVLLGTSNEDIAESISEIIPTQERRAATLARTVTNYAANKARNESIKQNTDVLDGYKWVATLDSRTSLICASRDGRIYEIDDRNPKPPAHFNCRSTITFVVNPEFDLGRDVKGTRPAKGDVKGDVSGDTTYAQWLRRQSPSFQEKVLGPARAKLFRSRKLSLDRFIDDRGNVLSLDELGINDELFI